MSLTKEKISEIIQTYRRSDSDTGSAEVQIALLTEKINHLTQNHFGTHIHDHHSKRGLLKMVSTRKNWLKYLRRVDSQRFHALCEQLGLRVKKDN